MTTMRDFREQRGRIVQEMRSLTGDPKGDGGDLSAEQEQRFTQLKGELESIEKRMERQQLVEDAERRMQGQQLAGTGDQNLDHELRDYSILRASASQMPGEDVDAGRERETYQELARRSGQQAKGLLVPMSIFEKRVVTTALPSGHAGGNLVSVDFRGDQFIDILRNKLITGRMGARVLRGLVGNLSIPKRQASGTAYWFAENDNITPGDPGFDAIGMTPRHVGLLIELSRNMLLQSSPELEQLTREDFSISLSQAIDNGAIASGGAPAPVGILGTSGINTVSMSGGPTWAKVLEVIESRENDNAEGTGFVTTPAWVKCLRSTPKATAVLIEEGPAEPVSADFLMDGPRELAGYPLLSSNLVPKTLGGGSNHALIFGAWADLILGYWGELEILVNPYESAAYSKGNVQVRGIVSMDVAVRHPESFCAVLDFNPAAS